MDSWQSLFEKLTVENVPKEPVNAEKPCDHLDVIEEAENNICVDCGTIVGRRIILSDNFSNTSTARRKPTVCPIYADIPDTDFDATVKNLAITIYKTATSQRIYRTTLRKAIIAACLYRASVLLNVSTRRCFSVFGLSNTEGNRGIVFVASHLPPGEYETSLFVDKSEVDTACSVAGITGQDVQFVYELFEKVKQGCDDVVASSQRISIIYGCVWAFIQAIGEDKGQEYPSSIQELIGRLNTDVVDKKIKRGLLPVSASTIQKKYFEIKKFIATRVMKRVFALCVAQVTYSVCLKSKTPTIPITVYNCTDPDDISATGDDGFIYHLSDVDDILDWNILFDMIYEDDDGNEIVMPICVITKSKNVHVLFDKCPYPIPEVGPEILAQVIHAYIKTF